MTFPILSPDCGLDPCRDTVPDFEAYLYDTWGSSYGDTTLNDYFKFDGDEDIWEADAGKPAEPFNTLVANMLADTNAQGELLYECSTLWAIWAGLVQGWERLKQDPDDPGNPSAFNPDFNMLEMFLQAAGVYWLDTAHTPYDANNGYLSWAHRYIRHDVMTTDCKTNTGYVIGWHGDVDSVNRWREIYGCWQTGERDNVNSRLERSGKKCYLGDTLNGDPMGEANWLTMSQADREDSCWVFTSRETEEECRTTCEGKRNEFAWSIYRAYADSGQAITFDEALCAADAIVDSCLGDCNLTVYGSGPIDSIGSTAEWEGIERVMRRQVVVSVPNDDGMGGHVCADTLATLAENRTMPYEELIEEYLNTELENYWAGNGGTYWTNFMTVLRQVAPDSIVSRITDSVIYVPPFAFGATPPRFELRNGCELWYVADTVWWSDISSGEHPMVTNLNAYLNALWGRRLDSTIAGRVADCDIVDDGHLIRQYEFKENTGDIYSSLIDQAMAFVSGSVVPQEVDEYLSFSSLYEESILYDDLPYARLMGQVRIEGTGGNTDLVSFTVVYPCTDTVDFLDLRHQVEGDGACADTSIIRLDAPNSDTTGYGLPSFYIIFDPPMGGSTASLDEILEEPFTDRWGKFMTDDEGYLIYAMSEWASHLNPDSCRVFGVRFFADPTTKLTDSICGLKDCPEVCWRWTDAEVDSSDAVRLNAPPCDETAARRMTSGIYSSINRCVDEAVYDLKNQYESHVWKSGSTG